MVRIAVAVLVVALGLCTGCFVFDEMDQGREIMERHSGRNPRPDAPAAVEVEEPEAEGPGLIARVQQFIQDRREPGPPERDPDDEIVTCDLQD
ncbi:MAG: hypothetical protein L0027_10045, partial [Candidatus Rokubacteria bacterium]|nr:hypothetical protein [Candidatus Rokubacteria bacterium]